MRLAIKIVKNRVSMSFFQTLKSKDLDDQNDSLSAPVDVHSHARWGFWVLLIGFLGFLLWACFAPLDEGVPTAGTVSIETKRKAVQHINGGIVKKVMVKEGQIVSAGQVLLVLDNASTKARYEEIRQHYLGLRAKEARLSAEQTGLKALQIHPDLKNALSDPLVMQQLQNQEILMASRKGSLAAELEGIDESIHGKQAAIVGSQSVLEHRKVQRGLLTEQIQGLSELVSQGYAPRNQLQELQLRLAQVEGDMADTMSAINQANRAIGELRQKAMTQKQEYRKEVDTQMAEVRLEVNADADKMKAASDDLNRVDIRSPASGQIVGLQFQTIGSVIQPGQKILDVVPSNEGLILEVKIPPNLIDRIHVEQKADVRFSSFSNTPLLKVEGRVNSVSYDLLTDPPSESTKGESYYLGRILITPSGIKTLGNRVLQSGMPVQVVIKTGERTLLTYLLHPFVKRLAASMKEE